MSEGKEKQQIIEAISQLGRRVTAADVATKTGLPLQLATSQLNRIASETGGDLQVATTGDIAYCFPLGFQNTYLVKGIARILQTCGATLFKIGFYILRISFGVMLIASLLAIVVLFFVLMMTLNKSGDDDRGGGFEFDFFDYLILRDLLWWGTWSTPVDYSHDQPYSRPRVTQKGNFLLDCFSFLFGDGNPNAHLEERQWQLVARAIKRNNGVATAEQLAPYTGVSPSNEYGVLPVLVRFDGRPEVTETGNIVYVFPSLQVSASGRHAPALPVNREIDQNTYLYEYPWQFTKANSPGWVAVLAGVNFFGAWWLFAQLHSAYAPILQPFAFLIYLLVIYGTLFVVIPAGRWLALQVLNKRIESRNETRSGYAEQLRKPSAKLSTKLDEAQHYQIGEHLVKEDKLIYTTEKDALEQEFERNAD